MHIWTDTPLDEIWNQLRYLTSPPNVRNVLSGQVESGRTTPWPESGALDKTAAEITACIRQADQYFRASRDVGMATRPLLQFYGAESLAKAVILASDDSLSLQDLKYHGLSTRPTTATEPARTNLQAYADDPMGWLMEREFAVTNDGVFPHLAKAAGDSEPPKGHVLYLKELLRIVPDMANLYTRHYGEPSHCLYLYSEPQLHAAGHFSVYFTGVSHSVIKQVFSDLGLPQFTEVTDDEYCGFRSTAVMSTLPPIGSLERGAVAGKYLVRPHDSGICKPITVLFAAMFVLSNIVRYKPAFWMGIVDGKESGAAAIAESLSNIFARQFPNAILSAIWNERFTYGGPAYVS